jgi:hypothetical protein
VRNIACGIIHPHRQVDAVALYNDVAILRLDEPLKVSISPFYKKRSVKNTFKSTVSFYAFGICTCKGCV